MWPFGKRATFSFRPKWKEELIVSGPGGDFVLVFWMGVPTVELPTQERWSKIAPEWVKPLWSDLRSELEAWCGDNNVALEISETAAIY